MPRERKVGNFVFVKIIIDQTEIVAEIEAKIVKVIDIGNKKIYDVLIPDNKVLTRWYYEIKSYDSDYDDTNRIIHNVSSDCSQPSTGGLAGNVNICITDKPQGNLTISFSNNDTIQSSSLPQSRSGQYANNDLVIIQIKTNNNSYNNTFPAKIIEYNTNGTYNVEIDNRNDILKDNDIDIITSYDTGFNIHYKIIHNVSSNCSPITGGSAGDTVNICITGKTAIPNQSSKLDQLSIARPSLLAQSESFALSQSATNPASNIQEVYNYIKDNIKKIIIELKSNNTDINLQELLEMAQDKLQQNQEFASMSNSKLVLFYDHRDIYGFFSDIRLGLFDEFKEKLTERGFVKSVKVAVMPTLDRLKKYFYLLHSVNPQDFTVLQYACYYNRLDIVILILSYLVAGERNYVQKYINYYNKKGDGKVKGRAIDLIDKSEGLGIISSAAKGVNLLKRTGKNVASFNVAALAGDIGKNLAKGVASGAISSQKVIEFLLQQFGSKNKGADADSSNVNIHKNFTNEIFINPSNKSNVSIVANASSPSISTDNGSEEISQTNTKASYSDRFFSLFKGESRGGKYKSRRYKKVNKRFTRRKI